MAPLAATGQVEVRQRSLLLPFVLLGAAFGVAEFLVELLPQYLFTSLGIDTQAPAVMSFYDLLDAAVRVALVPLALFLAFYLLASRKDINLGGSYFPILLSIFVGTMIVFLPVGVGRVLSSPPPPGFTGAEAVVQSIGASVGSSLNHAFIGFCAVFLWQMVNKPPRISSYVESTEKLHGLEDLSIVGVVMVVVYLWEYLARAYDAIHPVGGANELAGLFASVLGAGSPSFHAVAIWQQILLLLILPFALYFLIARYQKLNPFVQGRKILAIVFVWGLFLRTVPPFFYFYFTRLFDPNAFPSVTLASTFADEFVPTNLIGILSASFTFLFLGITAVVFAFFSNQKKTKPPQAPIAG